MNRPVERPSPVVLTSRRLVFLRPIWLMGGRLGRCWCCAASTIDAVATESVRDYSYDRRIMCLAPLRGPNTAWRPDKTPRRPTPQFAPCAKREIRPGKPSRGLGMRNSQCRRIMGVIGLVELARSASCCRNEQARSYACCARRIRSNVSNSSRQSAHISICFSNSGTISA